MREDWLSDNSLLFPNGYDFITFKITSGLKQPVTSCHALFLLLCEIYSPTLHTHYLLLPTLFIWKMAFFDINPFSAINDLCWQWTKTWMCICHQIYTAIKMLTSCEKGPLELFLLALKTTYVNKKKKKLINVPFYDSCEKGHLKLNLSCRRQLL